jgi:hypothetical protein
LIIFQRSNRKGGISFLSVLASFLFITKEIAPGKEKITTPKMAS